MKEITLDAIVDNIPVATDFINAELEAMECPMKAQMQIAIAIDELFGNIAHYAYAMKTGKVTVRVEFEKNPRSVVITFMDQGRPYDPLSAVEPDTTLSAKERSVGGLGIFLVKKTMDDVRYEYRDGQNILRIRKNV